MNLLYKQVEDGLLRITLLVGPPRCVSTGFAIALAQSPDVDFYVHEPFANDYMGKPSASAGAGLITQLLKRLRRSREVTDQHPAHIIIKECSTHLRAVHFRSLVKNSQSVIMMVRSPLLHLSSVARICKWIWLGCPRNFVFRIGGLKDRDIRRYAKNGDLQTYFLNGWKSLEKQIAFLDADTVGNARHAPSWLVIDTEIVRSSPRDFLKQISSQAGLRFTDRMICGWRKDHLFNIENDEWTWKASSARRLYRPRRHAPEMRDFPESWQGMFQTVLATYIRILQNEHFARLFSAAAPRRVCNGIVGSLAAFRHVPPDSRYGLTFTRCVSRQKACRIRDEIRRAHLKYEAIFDSVDVIMAGEGLHRQLRPTSDIANDEGQR